MNKIKLLILTGLLTFSSQMAFAQDSVYVNNEYAKSLALYNRALRYNDISVSKQALIEMSILTPRDTAILRSLAELYFGEGQYVSSAMVSLDMLSLQSNNTVALELAALSYENLRLYDKAIENYEGLWLATDNNSILYQVSYLQYLQKRIEEANSNLTILESKLGPSEKIVLSKQDGSVQEVNFAAAIQNLRGLIAQEQGNKEAAIAYFTKAIEISPDFEAPKTNLADMNKG